MYCNLFSLTKAMNDGYAMFGSKENPISIKNANVEISFDRILKSGLGMTMGVKIVPKKLVEYNFLSMDFIKAHNVLCHQDKSRTKATALKLGWKIKDDSICEDCLLGKIREKNMNKKVNFKALKFGERIMFDISSIRHVSIGGSKFWLKIVDEYSSFKWSFFLKKKNGIRKSDVHFHQETQE